MRDPIKRLYRKFLPFRYASDQAVLIEARHKHLERYRRKCPKSPAHAGEKFFSQGDEDGITLEILDRLGSLDKTFIEIGCGDGLENNTAALVLLGYRGCWVDGNKSCIAQINKALLNQFDDPRLIAFHEFVKSDNCEDIFEKCIDHIGSRSIDVISIDIDSNDIGVIGCAINVASPKCIIIEYNSSIPPLSTLGIDWQSDGWAYDDFQSGSLSYIAQSCPNYTLVACSSSGTNAYFIRNDLMNDQFETYPIRDLFVPPQFHLNEIVVGHRRTYRWLAMALER